MIKIKTTLIVATSKDLCISPENKDKRPSTDWTSKEDKKFFNQKTKEIGAMIMGSRTFATIGRALIGRLSVVMTRKPEKWRAKYQDEGIIFTNQNPEAILKDLKAKGFEEVAICGGRAIYNLFLELALVDKIYMTVEPIKFGAGINLFKNEKVLDQFKLISEKSLNKQGTVLREYSRI